MYGAYHTITDFTDIRQCFIDVLSDYNVYSNYGGVVFSDYADYIMLSLYWGDNLENINDMYFQTFKKTQIIY